jgi:hypothetical protein
MRRIFSPTFSGSLIVLLALSLLPRVFMFSFYDPLVETSTPMWKFITIGLMALFGYTVTTFLSKKPAGQAMLAALFGILTGILTTVIVDAIELLWLSESLDHTLLFRLIVIPDVALTVFHDLEANFGFWQYLRFGKFAIDRSFGTSRHQRAYSCDDGLRVKRTGFERRFACR